MKRIPSVEAFSPARGVGAAFPGVARLQFFRRRLSSTTAAVSKTAASWSSYVAAASSPKGLGNSVRYMTRQLSQHSLKVLNAVALTGAASAESDSNLSVDLEWRPALSAAQEVLCWGFAAVAVCSLYVLTAPTHFSLVYATCIGLLYGLLVYSLRSSLMEDMYKARERIEADLGDQDSRFRHINNLTVHVKVKSAHGLPLAAPTAAAAQLAPHQALKGPVPAVHCYHGFGSNTWSWSLVQQQLADRLGALVTAHDMPGFGLTQRPPDLSGYYLAFNGRLGRLALDYELAVRGLLSQAEAVRSGENGYPHASIHETEQGLAAAHSEGETVKAVEAESGGTASQAAAAAEDQGLESPLQATAAAAVEGSPTGFVEGAAAALADAATGSSGVSSSSSNTSTASGSSSSSSGVQASVKRVLMGHSLGSACAALEFIQNPDAYSAIVLVDPAIIADNKHHMKDSNQQDGAAAAAAAAAAAVDGITLEQLTDATEFTRSLASGDYDEPEEAAAAAHLQDPVGGSSSSSKLNSSSSSELDSMASAQGNLTRSSSSNSTSTAAAAAAGDVVFYATKGDDETFRAVLYPGSDKPHNTLLMVAYARALGLLRTFTMLITVMILSVLRPAIVLVLRMLVRSRTFWENTLKKAYYDQSKVSPEAVNAYRLPQLVQGWETGMIQFLMARLGAGGTRSSTTAAAAVGAAPMGGAEDAGLAHRFAAAVAAANIPVLIVHGAGDILLPVRNSFNLARLIKGCRLAVIKKAGHCPQEEVPELFTDVVAGFLKRHVAVAGA